MSQQAYFVMEKFRAFFFAFARQRYPSLQTINVMKMPTFICACAFGVGYALPGGHPVYGTRRDHLMRTQGIAVGFRRPKEVSVAMDDYGTGYSSLSMLNRLPIDRIKIDRAFVDELTQPARRRHIVEMIIALAGQLDLVTIGEGVESEAQAQMLIDLGCMERQGYFFGKPMAASDFDNYLQQSEICGSA